MWNPFRKSPIEKAVPAASLEGQKAFYQEELAKAEAELQELLTHPNRDEIKTGELRIRIAELEKSIAGR